MLQVLVRRGGCVELVCFEEISVKNHSFSGCKKFLLHERYLVSRRNLGFIARSNLFNSLPLSRGTTNSLQYSFSNPTTTMSRQVLVYGSAGQLGRAVSRAFNQKGFTVTGIDLAANSDCEENIVIREGRPSKQQAEIMGNLDYHVGPLLVLLMINISKAVAHSMFCSFSHTTRSLVVHLVVTSAPHTAIS